MSVLYINIHKPERTTVQRNIFVVVLLMLRPHFILFGASGYDTNYYRLQ